METQVHHSNFIIIREFHVKFIHVQCNFIFNLIYLFIIPDDDTFFVIYKKRIKRLFYLLINQRR